MLDGGKQLAHLVARYNGMTSCNHLQVMCIKATCDKKKRTEIRVKHKFVIFKEKIKLSLVG